MILADEPTGNLDTSTGTEIIEMLASLAADRGTTVIVATHDIGLAGRAQRRLAMRDGRFARHGGGHTDGRCRRRNRQLLGTSSRALRTLLGRAVPLGSVNPTPKEQRDEEHEEQDRRRHGRRSSTRRRRCGRRRRPAVADAGERRGRRRRRQAARRRPLEARRRADESAPESRRRRRRGRADHEGPGRRDEGTDRRR